MATLVLKLANVSCLLGDRWRLRNINLEISSGEIVAVVGANGAGKSTLLRVLAGMLAPTQGRILLDDVDLYRQRDRVTTRIGIMPEQPTLYEDLSVQAYLHFMATLHGFRKAQLTERVAIVVRECQLEPVTQQVIRTLSLGFRQRVSLAQSRLHQPEVLILDEPTHGLDPLEAEKVGRLLRTLSAGQTVIFSSHVLQDVVTWCTRVIVIQAGVVIADECLDGSKTASDLLSLFPQTVAV